MRFGLIGNPIAHSLSPSLFKAGYDGKYMYDLIETDSFEEAFRRFTEEYDGINVTAPFKEPAYMKADIVSEECRMIGASNLLVKTPEGIKAYNSDYLGVLMWIQQSLHHPAGEWEAGCPAVLIAGCGGAGKAAAAAAAVTGCRTVLMNRSIGKAIELADSLTDYGFDAKAEPMEEFCRCFRDADIVIYNIPVPISQLNELKADDFAPGKRKCTMEANYRNPSMDSSFISKMTEANPLIQHTTGRTWLLYQAITGYEIFTGEKPDLEKMSAIL